MRKVALILFLLSACGTKTPREEASAPETGSPMPANFADSVQAEDPARLQGLIDRAMPAALKDPKAAQYRNVRAGAGGSACGEVAVKAGAPFVPFVVSPEALAVVGTRPQIAWEDPDDFLADAWIRWCATPEELAKLRPKLDDAARAPIHDSDNVSAAVPPPLDPSILAIDPPPPPPSDSPLPAPKPKPAPPAPPAPRIDSFFNSVQHKDP
jgi:hypothetical protein